MQTPTIVTGLTSTPLLKPRKPSPPREERMSWAVFGQLELGQAVDVPDRVPITRISAAITSWQHRTGWRFSRRGHRVWRVE